MGCRRRLRLIGILAIAALAASGSPPAESAADVRREVIRAFMTASSFRTTVYSSIGYTSFTFVKPHRLKSVVRYSGDRRGEQEETVAIDTTWYRRENGGGPWYRTTSNEKYSPDIAAPAIFRTKRFVLLPDRRENGRIVGAFEMPRINDRRIMMCTYEKSTYRLRRCVSDLPFTAVYDRWNDRSNVVSAPLA